MSRRIVVLTIALIVTTGVLSAVLASRRTEVPKSLAAVDADGAATKSTAPSIVPSGTPRSDEATPTPASPRPAGDAPRLRNVTAGSFYKSGSSTTISTDPVRLPGGSLVLVHLMSCCDHATVPTVAGPELPFELAVTHETGEKRHWVFAAVSEGADRTGSLRFTFDRPQDRVLWIVDEVSGGDFDGGVSDVIVQTAWQDSQTNATGGAIELEPLADPERSLGVAFALAGSGTAVDIQPEGGAQETAEAEVPGSSLLIDTFWAVGQDRLRASFLDAAGQPAVESWLFLALEVHVTPSG